MPDLLNSHQAAERLNLSPLTLTEYARKGILNGQKVGREWLFLASDVEKLAEQRGGKANGK